MTLPDFTKLYVQELSFVWNSLRRFGVPQSDLEDLTQEVFTAAFRGLDRFQPSRPVRPWLFGIAFRVASNQRRRVGARREVASEAAAAITDGRASPQTNVERAQTLERVQQALDTLSMERKALFILHDIEGHGMPEVAEALDVPLNTAYTRLRAARADFTAAYRKQSGEEPP